MVWPSLVSTYIRGYICTVCIFNEYPFVGRQTVVVACSTGHRTSVTWELSAPIPGLNTRVNLIDLHLYPAFSAYRTPTVLLLSNWDSMLFSWSYIYYGNRTVYPVVVRNICDYILYLSLYITMEIGPFWYDFGYEKRPIRSYIHSIYIYMTPIVSDSIYYYGNRTVLMEFIMQN